MVADVNCKAYKQKHMMKKILLIGIVLTNNY